MYENMLIITLSDSRANMHMKNCTIAIISTGTMVVVRSSFLFTMEAIAVFINEYSIKPPINIIRNAAVSSKFIADIVMPISPREDISSPDILNETPKHITTRESCIRPLRPIAIVTPI